MAEITLRDAVPEDAAQIIRFVTQLAEYEKLAHEMVATEVDVQKHLFGPRPRAHAIIAEWEGKPAGLAIYFYNFSTFLFKPGIYLEDLFVDPDARGKGIGRAILAELAARAVGQDCGRVDWSVLDWNEPSIEFYKLLGARPMDEWTGFRLDGDAMMKLAQERM